nr:MAG TPA: hypothetical protein [Caudoviricetes sp.]
MARRHSCISGTLFRVCRVPFPTSIEGYLI